MQSSLKLGFSLLGVNVLPWQVPGYSEVPNKRDGPNKRDVTK